MHSIESIRQDFTKPISYNSYFDELSKSNPTLFKSLELFEFIVLNHKHLIPFIEPFDNDKQKWIVDNNPKAYGLVKNQNDEASAYLIARHPELSFHVEKVRNKEMEVEFTVEQIETICSDKQAPFSFSTLKLSQLTEERMCDLGLFKTIVNPSLDTMLYYNHTFYKKYLEASSDLAKTDYTIFLKSLLTKLKSENVGVLYDMMFLQFFACFQKLPIQRTIQEPLVAQMFNEFAVTTFTQAIVISWIINTDEMRSMLMNGEFDDILLIGKLVGINC